MYVGILPAFMSVYHVGAVPEDTKESIGSSERGVTDGC